MRSVSLTASIAPRFSPSSRNGTRNAITRTTVSAHPRRASKSDQEKKKKTTRIATRLQSTTDDKNEKVEEEEACFPWAAPGYKGAWVSQQDDQTQRVVVASIWIGILVLTYLSCAKVGPFVEHVLPDSIFQFSKRTWPVLGATYVLAGAAHFALPEGFDAMVPHENAFGGLWKLPGSKRFHVNWTGVCEIVGGLGTLSLLFDQNSSLGKASAFGLFLLTLAVTPANTYMFTNNSPGPLPPDATEEMMVLTPAQHFARGLLQVFLLTMLWGVATSSN
jgi:uncharacterized membrane protein